MIAYHPTWQEVYGGQLPDTMPPAPKVSVPYVAEPQCPEHCSGRHDCDGIMACERCQVPAYYIWQHEWAGRHGIYFSLLQPVNGMPPYRKNMPCPMCGSALRRQ